MHAPNQTPNVGFIYQTVHNTEIQEKRHLISISFEPYVVSNDYVLF